MEKSEKGRVYLAIGLTIAAALVIYGWHIGWCFGLVWAYLNIIGMFLGARSGSPGHAIGLSMTGGTIMVLPACFIAGIGPALTACLIIGPSVVGVYSYFAGKHLFSSY